MMTVEDVMRLGPVIPVLTIENAADALPIATALVRGGVRALEVTLRTPAALEVIRLMATVDGACVGAGTVLNAKDLDLALNAGAQFIVSPGLTDALAAAATQTGAAFLPGVATASDIMRALDHGFSHLKFFPAEANGGIPALRALSGPFGQVRFCPTGGISLATAPAWLALPEVLCCGGSWLVPRGAPDVEAIAAAARLAADLR